MSHHSLVALEAATQGGAGAHCALPAGNGSAEPGDAITIADSLDQWYHGLQGRWTGGISPLSWWRAWSDWCSHLANSPFRSSELVIEAGSRWLELMVAAVDPDSRLTPERGDQRFQHPAWGRFPYSLMVQDFLQAQRWMNHATRTMPGVAPENARMVRFSVRQWLDCLSPSNLPFANPEILERTLESGGQNLVAGLEHLLQDAFAGQAAPAPEAEGFSPGRELAITPGKVIFRNTLLELIQYSPSTPEVHAEPILIVPAWIMKYYILDLSPENSLIRYLVGQGFTVFCISWRNPNAEMAETGFDDYRREGVMAALDVVTQVTGASRVHGCGYCLGGTLLTVAAATMARDGDERLASLTLLAAQTDFSEAGELRLFITEGQLSVLEATMTCSGYLEGHQMGAAFQMLRSRDLIWSRLVRRYWLGEEEHSSDLMAWNADATRMPARMHTEYLRSMFQRNDLAEGRFIVEGRPVTVSDIHAPLFVVGTETDHVSPWRSVYKIHLLNPGEITFLLTSGGHNAGIVSEPGHPRRHFRIDRRTPGAVYRGPEQWCHTAAEHEGSWWPAWTAWLAERAGPLGPPPPIGGRTRKPLADAPGTYVLER